MMESLPGYDAWRTRTPWDDSPDHLEECPCHEDSEPMCAECGLPELPHQIVPISQLSHNFVADDKPECICPTPAELKADREEARHEARMDRED